MFEKIPLILAPMEDITDSSFRLICKEFGADLVFTEFISSEGLIRNAVKSTVKLDFNESERPIAVQIFGHDIESMKMATHAAEAYKPDIIDINFGCPVKKVVSKGAGAGMLKDPEKMIQITKAVVESTTIPVTVKTRLGWDENSKIIVELAEKLQDTGIVALSIHGRTRSQMYSGKADWTLIGEVKNNPRIKIPIIGNGDIDCGATAFEKLKKYGVDGIMIGRAAIGNPWIFSEVGNYLEGNCSIASPDLGERISVCLKHLKSSCLIKGERRGVLEMRKHYSGYFKGIKHFKDAKIAMLSVYAVEEVEQILLKFASKYCD